MLKKIKGFDPNGSFMEHRLAVRFKNSFLLTILSEEEYNNLSAPSHNAGYLKTILSTNEFYKQKGKGPSEKSAQSPTLKTTTSQNNAPMARPTRKVTNTSSSGRGEKNPLREKLRARTRFLLERRGIMLYKRKKTTA
jgi:hypothetical protein